MTTFERVPRSFIGLCIILTAATLGLPAISFAQKAGDGRTASVTFLPSQSTPLVAIRLVFRVGSQDDPKGKEGLAALTAGMIAQGGSKELSYDQVLEKFYPMATELSGNCRKEVTVFAGVIHRDNFSKYVPLLGSLLATPRFSTEDFERIRNEALDYLSKTLRGGNDEVLGKWTLQLALYRGHPYGHVDVGTLAGLKSITLDDVKAFHRKHYTREALELGVGGSADQDVLDQIRAAISSLPSHPLSLSTLPKAAAPKGLEVTIVEKPAASTAISLGFPIDVTRRDSDFYALAVANSYLGEHRTFNGKLMQDLRGKRGLNYGDYSYLEDFIQDGMSTFPVPNNLRRQQAFTIWLRPVPDDKAAFALRAALWELDRLTTDGISAEDFETTRAYLLNYSKLWIQSISRRLGYAMDGNFYGGADLVSEMSRRLPKLTVEEVNAAIRRHLKKQGIAVSVVTKDAQALAKILKSNAPSPIVYDTQGTSDTILIEDKAIASFPLKDLSIKIIPAAEMFEK